jgi:Ca-activated chloride channel family protein
VIGLSGLASLTTLFASNLAKELSLVRFLPDPWSALCFSQALRLPSIILCSTVTSYCLAQAQVPTDQNQAQNKIVLNSELVVLPVTVKDQSGNLVSDLRQDDFRIFDDNIEQSIDVFSSQGTSLSLLVLIDADLKDDDAAQMVASLHPLIAGIGAEDEVLICHFDLRFLPAGGFTKNPDQLFSDLEQAREASKPGRPMVVPFATDPSWHVATGGEPSQAAPTNLGSRPTKALDDAIYSSAQLFHDRVRDRRKVILLVSDGINGPEFNKHNYDEALTALLKENISVYSLAVGGTSFHKKFSRLFNYANDSGGDTYYAKKSSAMEELYSQITEEARHEYTLAYVPRGNQRGSSYHAVQVIAKRPGLLVKTRQGYYTTTSVTSPNNK